MERLLNIDRRIIFIAVALILLIGLLLKANIPLPASPEATALFEEVENAPTDKPIIVSMDYGPASAPELSPMSRAVIHHALSRGIRVLGISFDTQGAAGAETMINTTGEALGKTVGEDYVFLGFLPDITAALLQMGGSIPGAFPEVTIGEETTPAADLPIMQGVENFDDISIAVQMTGSKDYEKWINFANARFGLKLATGATGAIVTGLYPFLNSGQISGLLRSARGAADYERLVADKYPGLPTDAGGQMSVHLLGHLMLLVFIALANVGMWMSRREADTG